MYQIRSPLRAPALASAVLGTDGRIAVVSVPLLPPLPCAVTTHLVSTSRPLNVMVPS